MTWKDLFKKRGGANAETAEQVALLVARLAAPAWEDRVAACEGLAAFGPRAAGAVPALQERIEDERGEVCTAAAAALSAIERGG